MSRNFSLKELIASDTASREGIDNTPSFEVVFRLNELCDDLLQPLRDAWGKPLKVTSGYRSKELNKRLKGSSSSAHLVGWAADIVPLSDFPAFIEFVREWIKDKDFDQCLIERSGGTRWLHIGIRNQEGKQRHQIKDIVL